MISRIRVAGVVLVHILAGLLAGCAAVEPPVLAPGSTPIRLLTMGAGEGPAWSAKVGFVFSGDGVIGSLGLDRQYRVFRSDAGTNGLLFDARGRLLACEPRRRRVTRQEPDGALTVLAETYGGRRFNSPNDLAVDSRGRIYFSDPRYGPRDDMEIVDDDGRPVEGVYRIDPDGALQRILAHEVDRPNGVLVSSDDRWLFVADNNNDEVDGARKLWRFDLRDDGSIDLASQKLVFDWGTSRGPDGMAQDARGRLYVAAGLNRPNPPAETAEPYKGGIYVLTVEGALLDFVPIPDDEVTNCAFGSEDLRTLVITAGGRLWSVRTAVPGSEPGAAPGGAASVNDRS